MKKKNKISINNIASVGVMAAVICILGPLSIPIGIVPISLTVLAVYLAVYILGRSMGTLSYLIYLLIGLMGVPVFSGFSAGPTKLFGPTGGYLVGFLFMAEICGFFIDHYQKWYMSLLGMILGTCVCYLFGSLWLSYQAKMTFAETFAVAVAPFIVGDLIKMIISLIIGPIIRKQLKRARIFPVS